MRKQIIGIGMTLILAAGCITQSQKKSSDLVADLQELLIDTFFEESYKKLLLRSPQAVTMAGLSQSFGMRNNELNNLSDSYIRETQEFEVAILELLHTYDREKLTKEQKLSYDIYEWYLDDKVRGHEFMYYNYPVHHFLMGYHDELIQFFTEIYPITSFQDAQDYVTCLSQVDTQVDQLIEGLELREKAGVVPPRFILEMTIQKMRGYLNYLPGIGVEYINAESLDIYTVFSEKVRSLNLSEEEEQNLLAAALKETEESFVPAYVKLTDFLENQLSISTNDAGVWKFPKGDEYYDYVLQHETSTDMTPEEIHELGLKEVARIQGEMRSIFSELGYSENEPLDELMNRIAVDGGLCDRDDLIKEYEAILDDIDKRLTAVFDIHPRQDLVVVGDPSYCGASYYLSGSYDGSRPGAFHAGEYGCLQQAARFSMQDKAYHEGIPGHHFQLAIALELDLPLFRRDIPCNGYVEGWALYAEQLAWELGVYEDYPYGDIGRLHLELLRAVRLVTDTGIHDKKWTREQAKAYMREVLGNIDEVDRYIVLPGQATSYKVGMIKILELRERAQKELGDTFDIKEFHRVVLGNGVVPLAVLEKVVNDYINAKMGRSPHVYAVRIPSVLPHGTVSELPQEMSDVNSGSTTSFRSALVWKCLKFI